MDAEGDTFRIVTRGEFWEGSNLFVASFRDPDRPERLGELRGIAPSEDLHATRFDGNRAYVVTYEPVILQTDPLWVVSLDNPSAPTILGHLEIPGWSDYVFPRGDQLVAVGRGDRGSQVAVSLFDVSNPSQPTELSRVAFGTDAATSEANTDFRAATLVGVDQTNGLVVVPYTTAAWGQTGCETEHHVQLVDLHATDLSLRGATSPHEGAVRRTLPVGADLYALGEGEVAALDISNRDDPRVVASIDISADRPPATSDDDALCESAWTFTDFGNDDMVDYEGPLACTLAPGQRSRGATGAALAMGLFGLIWARRRRRA
jgi:hypothetical protein